MHALKNKSIKNGQGHIIPVNTRIINHLVYRHTYQPMYTCTMEDEVSNVYDNSCGM